MVIGGKNIKGYAALAPMAGVADRAFRELCMQYGAAFCVTELISSKAVCMGDKKSLEFMQITDSQRPIGIQLFGSDPKTMAQAAVIAQSYHPDFIDINMGCPAPKVLSSGGGSALLRAPKLAAEIAEAVVRAVDIPVSVKMRIGFDSSHLTAAEISQRCEEAGVNFITIHGRTREQMYAPPANLTAITEIKKSVDIPVIGNGDVYSPADADKMYSQTGCDFIMIGRGSLGAPWIFRDINAFYEEGKTPSPPDISSRMNVLLRHAEMISEYKGERTAMLEIRKHAAWYIKGIKGAAKFRQECSAIENMRDLKKLCETVCEKAAEG